MEENKKVSINIQGNKYVIKGENSKEHIHKIAKQVDHIMEGLGKSNTLMNKNMIAVLCSLNLADQLYNAQQEIAQLEDRLIEAEGMPELKIELESVKDDAQFNLEKYKEAQKSLKEMAKDLEKNCGLVDEYKNKTSQHKIEIDAARQTIMDLQNQIFDNQIEIVKMKKEIDGYKNKEIMGKRTYSNKR